MLDQGAFVWRKCWSAVDLHSNPVKVSEFSFWMQQFFTSLSPLLPWFIVSSQMMIISIQSVISWLCTQHSECNGYFELIAMYSADIILTNKVILNFFGFAVARQTCSSVCKCQQRCKLVFRRCQLCYLFCFGFISNSSCLGIVKTLAFDWRQTR
jgi:hypothetical protein